MNPVAARSRGTKPSYDAPALRLGLLYLDVRSQKLHCLNETARQLHEEGVAANVLNVTSPGLLYRGLAEARRRHLRRGTTGAEAGHLETLIPPDERRAPIVTVQDGASHALSFLGSAFGARVVPLGVDEFGQSGTRADLYRYYGIDGESIVSAALLALDLT